MKGVILAGGSGTRLMPLTKVTNKHLLPVAGKPMLFYPIEKLVAAGITDILIVTGTNHMGDIVGCLGSGKDFGCRFTYRVQDEAGGIAQALSLARGFCYGERMCVLLGDNIFEDDLSIWVDEFHRQERGARLILKLVPNLDRYGIAVTNDAGKVCEIIEKPSSKQLNILHDNDEYTGFFAVTGIYFYDQRVFDIVDTLSPSGRGEFEITDVNNRYLEWGELRYSKMDGGWTDAGTHQSLWFANQLLATR
jgi:glucose-1-phosphate thymidylyltransferase